MPDIRLEVDVREAVDDLDLTEKKLLVEYLKNDMEDDFEIPLSDEERRSVRSLESTVWVDVDDAISEMSHFDKKDLYTELHEEFGEPEEEVTPFGGGTYSEDEFGKILAQLWEDRWLLTADQKARIAAITRENFV